MILKLKRTPGIYLAGFMGSGKTTVGQALAEKLGWRFVDLDDEMEAAEGSTISEMFETKGEDGFRDIEADALNDLVRRISQGQPSVVALGGGTMGRESNRRLMQDNGVVIWLDTPFEVARQRVAGFTHRPLARDPEKFKALFEQRRPIYATAEYTIDAGADEADVIVRKVMELGII